MWVLIKWRQICLLHGAQNRNRTGDLILTKDVLCQLSYLGRPRLRCKKRKRAKKVKLAILCVNRNLRSVRKFGRPDPRGPSTERGSGPYANAVEARRKPLADPERLLQVAREIVVHLAYPRPDSRHHRPDQPGR